MAAMDSSSSCGPQEKAQPPPPAAQAPNPTRVMSIPVLPRGRVGRVVRMTRDYGSAAAKAPPGPGARRPRTVLASEVLTPHGRDSSEHHEHHPPCLDGGSGAWPAQGRHDHQVDEGEKGPQAHE